MTDGLSEAYDLKKWDVFCENNDLLLENDQLKAENEKLRELVRDLYKDLAAILGDGLWMEPYESEMMELEVDA